MNSDKLDNSFYSQKIDDKYNILNRSIGIDKQTKFLSTRIIESTNIISGDSLNGQYLTFNFTVSPSAYIDWNKSVMEIGFKFTNYNNTAVVSNSSIPWNLLLYIFEEVKIKFNSSVVYNKIAGEYLETQTFKLLTEYTNDELNASDIVFAPVGDYNYHVGLENGYGFEVGFTLREGAPNTVVYKDKAGEDPNAKLRFYNWISNLPESRGRVFYKRPTFKELFFDMPGFSKNLRNVTIEVKLKDKIPLPSILNKAANQEDIMIIRSMKLQLHEYNYSPEMAMSSLNNKINSEIEHVSFIDVSKQDRIYNPYLSIPSKENVQWVAVTQFCHNVSSKIGGFNEGKYQNCGQFLLMNGYAEQAANAAVNNLIHRTDLPPTFNENPPRLGTRCFATISSIQAQYGNVLYPSNAIDTGIDDSPTLLKTDELYNEYKKAVGFKNPAVPPDVFRRTMPFFLVKFTPNLKLVKTGDIIIRMPGFKGAANTGNKIVSIIYGQIKSFNILPSGIVNIV